MLFKQKTVFRKDIKKSDLLVLDKSRLCLISCHALKHNSGRFAPLPNDDYLDFMTESNAVFQNAIQYSTLFESIVPTNN